MLGQSKAHAGVYQKPNFNEIKSSINSKKARQARKSLLVHQRALDGWPKAKKPPVIDSETYFYHF